jgi:hypothetical protein
MFPDCAAPYYSIGSQRIDNKKLVYAIPCVDEEPVRYSNLTCVVGRGHLQLSIHGAHLSSNVALCIRQWRARISACLGSRFVVQNSVGLRVTLLRSFLCAFAPLRENGILASE